MLIVAESSNSLLSGIVGSFAQVDRFMSASACVELMTFCLISASALCCALLEHFAFHFFSFYVELFLTVSRVNSSLVGVCHFGG